MPCPNCGTNDVWDDNLHWGCNRCKWCSLAGLNPTRTPSSPYSLDPDYTEVERRKADWAQRDAEADARRAAIRREEEEEAMRDRWNNEP